MEERKTNINKIKNALQLTVVGAVCYELGKNVGAEQCARCIERCMQDWDYEQYKNFLEHLKTFIKK